jgi:shikimate dehydrogenase
MAWISGATRIHLIVGDPIAQTKSPGGLTREFAARRVDAACVPIQIRSEDFDAFMTAAKSARNIDGIVITVPHKFAAAAHCDQLSDRARLLAAVNVMRRRPDGLWTGDMTDGVGLVAALRAHGCEPRGARALVVGAGGAGSAVALALVAERAAEVSICDLDRERRDSLVGLLGGSERGVRAGTEDPSGLTLVVNASPAGMAAGDPLHVDVARLSEETFVADLITSPPVTPLLAAARARGCRTLTGEQMFQSQVGLLADFLLERPR